MEEATWELEKNIKHVTHFAQLVREFKEQTLKNKNRMKDALSINQVTSKCVMKKDHDIPSSKQLGVNVMM